jgi:hypothetical protein
MTIAPEDGAPTTYLSHICSGFLTAMPLHDNLACRSGLLTAMQLHDNRAGGRRSRYFIKPRIRLT